MSKNFVYFDLETMRTANDVGGWSHKDKMGMSIGVTYSTARGGYRIYDEATVQDLITELTKADLCIGFNHISFDYGVLQGYTFLDLNSQILSLDLMVDLEAQLGHRPKLEAVAAACLGTGKSADGLDAIRWWKEGKIMKIAEYCCFDVKVTRMVHEFGIAHGFVRYTDRFGNCKEVPVNWVDPKGNGADRVAGNVASEAAP
jgi:DEAD/DEAH box helicase domain-containing protein